MYLLHFPLCFVCERVCILWPRANPFACPELKPWQESLNEAWKMAPADLALQVIFPAEKNTCIYVVLGFGAAAPVP